MQWTDRIGRRVKLRDLHVFLAVAQAGSMAKAAEQLGVSQPVVSKTISDLEHALAVRLLDRNFRGVEPTTHGDAFVDCSTAVFDEIKRGVQQLTFLSDPTVGELRVGCTTPLADGLIPAILERLTTRYPKISLRVSDGDSPTLCRLLRDRNVDVVVGRTWGKNYGDDFTAEPLFDEALFVVAGLESPWLRRRKIKFTQLLDEAWVLPESENVVGMLVAESFRRAGISPPTARIISNSMSVRVRLVESGPFLSLLPGSMLHFGASRLKLKALTVRLPLQTQPVEITTLKDRTPNPIARLFIEELRDLVRPLSRTSSRSSK
jgi:DNA-binding transcriptional LysR family regulator